MRHNINPVIADLGPLQIRWYGFFYLLSFLLGFWLLRRNFRYRGIKLSKDDYENFLFNLCLGVIIGGRLGYVLFYNLGFYLHNPLKLLAVWEGGMSFHGGAIAVLFIGWLFCRKHGYNFFQLADVTAPIGTIGLALGRLGNFINGELYGKVTDLPWGVIFPDGGEKPRHPSQLYEMLLEGIVLFIITQTVLRKSSRQGIVLWVWLLGYGSFRFLVEFVRIPDEQLGYFWNVLTMGQILSGIMILAGLAGILFHHPRPHENKS
ncbi:MAG: prolipoprotein diacylglyceryl transferase [Candidatus Cloacimonetes bacterium]|nr:prolipoprotein diacylglyceryl transferase [Candidatus Cloacimonadota bacterium]